MDGVCDGVPLTLGDTGDLWLSETSMEKQTNHNFSGSVTSASGLVGNLSPREEEDNAAKPGLFLKTEKIESGCITS